ncbi:hypothetical protein BDP27DRAFT_1330828, partial [Rhodocollybia butyracea]
LYRFRNLTSAMWSITLASSQASLSHKRINARSINALITKGVKDRTMYKDMMSVFHNGIQMSTTAFNHQNEGSA